MNIRLIQLTAFIVLISMLACTNKTKNEHDQLTKKEMLADSVTSLEKSLHRDSILDPEKASKMRAAYLSYVNSYPKDSIAPEYLFRAAEIALNNNKPLDACSYLYRIKNQYPDYPRMPGVLFQMGHIYDSRLNDIQKAKKYYGLFLRKYPEHPLSADVSALIKLLEVDDLSMIRKFEAQNSQEEADN